jgi:histidinol-phosphate/aromatic aminotransferase/cobyric acid decarboxylase-like protein
MAGLRAGAAMARPDLLRKINQFTSGFMPVTATTGAIVSLNSKTLIPERRKIVHDIREETLAFLASRKIETIPSEANMFMMNVKRPGREFATAMLNEKVAIGRTWPVMPTWVRVTVGTAAEMEKFRAACLKCYTA